MKKEGEMQFVLRIDKKLVKKLDYIAAYHGRSRNSEILWALRLYANQFEKKVDAIPEE